MALTEEFLLNVFLMSSASNGLGLRIWNPWMWCLFMDPSAASAIDDSLYFADSNSGYSNPSGFESGFGLGYRPRFGFGPTWINGW